MDQTTFTLSANTPHCALELSKNSWLLAIQFWDREQPSLYPIEGGNTEKLMAKLTGARDCWAKVSGAPPVSTLCYEVGRPDGRSARPEPLFFTRSRLQPLARKSVGANIQNFTSSVAIDRSVNWLPGIADDRPDQRRPMP
jgi:hypothetical protein